jgi:hypothetical protein
MVMIWRNGNGGAPYYAVFAAESLELMEFAAQMLNPMVNVKC